MKLLSTLAIVLLLSNSIFAKEDWKTPFIMEKINRIHALYDAGLEQHQKGSTKQGCYIVRQAVRESWELQSDNKMTYNQMRPLYKQLCNIDY